MFTTEEKVKDLKVKLLKIERHKTDFVGVLIFRRIFSLFLQPIQNVYGYFIPKDKIERQNKEMWY
jgi:hypothetical protein